MITSFFLTNRHFPGFTVVKTRESLAGHHCIYVFTFTASPPAHFSPSFFPFVPLCHFLFHTAPISIHFSSEKQRIQIHLYRSDGRHTVCSAVLPPVSLHECHMSVFSDTKDAYWRCGKRRGISGEVAGACLDQFHITKHPRLSSYSVFDEVSG